MARHGLDGGEAPAGRFPPERNARALVFLGGRLRVVAATAEDRCSVVDLETWADVHRLKLVGALTHAHVERPGPNSEYLVTRASAAVTIGPRTGRRSELAWFAADGAGLRRVHRLFRRGPLATELVDETPADLLSAAVLSDGMLVDGDDLVAPRAVGEERQRLVRYTDAPVRAVVGEAVTQTRRLFLLGEDGLVTATAANDVRRWYGVVRGHAFERLALSGDGAILCATMGRTLVTWSAEDGALLAIRSLGMQGTLHPAPVGRHAVWETAAGPELLLLETPEAPLAAPARLDQAVRIESRELVVHGDTDGMLRGLVGEVIDGGVDGAIVPSRFATGAPPFVSSTLTVASSGAGPATLLEPWQLTRGASSMWLEGFVLRGLVEEAPVQEAERRRRSDRRDAALVSEANRNATRSSVKVSEALEAAIFADPDAREPYLVYGDWLLEQGDPRGELIALQVRLAETPDDVALRNRERALLAQHGKGWLGALARDFEGTWRAGFVRDLHLAHITTRKWHELGTLPAFRFVRSMTLSVLGDPSAFLAGAETRGYPKLLRALVVSLRPDASARFLATIASSAIRTLTLAGPFDFAILRAATEALEALETLRITAPLSAAHQARIRADLPNVPLLFTAP